ncbi:hypothetical protein JRQ81_017626, partial [Phrynocephalus forsythii]
EKELHQEQPLDLAQRNLNPSAHQEASTKPRRRRVVVVRDSLLRGTEAVICRPDKMNREVCWSQDSG